MLKITEKKPKHTNKNGIKKTKKRKQSNPEIGMS